MIALVIIMHNILILLYSSTMVGSVILSAQVEYSNGSIVNKPPGDIVLDVANMIELNFTVNVIEQGPGLAGVTFILLYSLNYTVGFKW